MKTIKKVAQRTRKWAKDKNRRKRSFESNLSGMCGIAAVRLFENLTEDGFEPMIAVSNAHAFVICDNYVVDVTATQFGRKPVEILPLTDAEEVHFWHYFKTFHSPNSFIEHQQSSGWCSTQIATKKSIRASSL